MTWAQYSRTVSGGHSRIDPIGESRRRVGHSSSGCSCIRLVGTVAFCFPLAHSASHFDQLTRRMASLAGGVAPAFV